MRCCGDFTGEYNHRWCKRLQKAKRKKREQLFEVIKARSLSYSVAWASIEEIESINILNAAMLAMKRAVEDLSIKADFALIDGNKVPDLDIPAFPVVKGDSLSMSIACASILAKVSRDRLMYKYDEKYPEYGFAKHKGYGTKLHTQVLREIGPCEIHRPSFLKKYWVKKMLKPNEIGRSGEERTQKYLLKNGYEILDTNFHSRWGEIDIVAKREG